MPTEHTVKAFDEELAALDRDLLAMGGLVEAQTARAVTAVVRRDTDLAGALIAGDSDIDRREQDLQSQVERIFALRQPLAQDLRTVLGALQISSNLERAGDLASSVAKRSILLSETWEIPGLWVLPKLGNAAHAMLRDVLDAYGARNPDKAREIWSRDAELDDMYATVCRELLTHMIEDPRRITPGVHLLFVAKCFERIADHATNIAELIDYVTTGTRDLGDRPRGDMDDIEGPAQAGNG